MLEHVTEADSWIFARGCQIIPPGDFRDRYIADMTPEQKADDLLFRTVDAPKMLAEAKKRLKEYVIDPEPPNDD
jgi:hypothetical protein